MKLVPDEILQVLMFLSALDLDELEDNDVDIELEGIVETLCTRLLMRKADIDNNIYIQIISFFNLFKICITEFLKDIIVWAEVNISQLVIED